MINGFPKHTIRKNRGFVTVAALVCLGLAGAIFVSLLQRLNTQRRDVDRLQRTVQARWLAESGLQRAAAQLADDAGYSGETWIIPADKLDGRQTAQVTIAVPGSAEEMSEHSIEVSALFPDSKVTGVRVNRRVELRAQSAEKK
jgi:type II secretory pathway component PulK